MFREYSVRRDMVSSNFQYGGGKLTKYHVTMAYVGHLDFTCTLTYVCVPTHTSPLLENFREQLQNALK